MKTKPITQVEQLSKFEDFCLSLNLDVGCQECGSLSFRDMKKIFVFIKQAQTQTLDDLLTYANKHELEEVRVAVEVFKLKGG